MTTRINLLPWREEERKRQREDFLRVSLAAVALMGVIIFFAHVQIGGMIDNQESRNKFLQGEIAKVDEKIKEIKELENQKKMLLNKMNVIQDLQTRRPLVVRMMDELVRIMPNGVFLTKIDQKGQQLLLEGVAQSNARVSSLMRNLDESSWFTNPKLDVIQVQEREGSRESRFSLKVNQATPGGAAGTS